jgi:hypothetical protein
MWGLLAAGVGLAVIGFGFRLGNFRALGWAYFDPEWTKNRFYRNAMFAVAPGSFMFLAGFLAGFVEDGSLMGVFLLLIAMSSVLVAFVTFIRPAGYMKPRWIREIDQELKGDPQADLRRREVLRKIRSHVDWSEVHRRLPWTRGSPGRRRQSRRAHRS